MAISILRLDHLVLTVRDIDKTIQFYTTVFGMELETFGQGRKALRFGQQKINLHVFGKEFEPKAQQPTPGSADLCLISETPINKLSKHSKRRKLPLKKVQYKEPVR